MESDHLCGYLKATERYISTLGGLVLSGINRICMSFFPFFGPLGSLPHTYIQLFLVGRALCQDLRGHHGIKPDGMSLSFPPFDRPS
jgi:hypothetical protein